MPKTIYIRSQNDIFQKFETLKRNRYKRHTEGAFILEGVKPIKQAILNSWTISGLIYTDANPPSRWAEEVFCACPNADRYILTPGLMGLLSDKEESSEIIALVKFSAINSIDQLSFADDKPPLIVAFDRPQNPGNLGTVIRSCSSFGADALIITGHCADMYDPQTIRSSIGAFFALPVIHTESFAVVDRLASRLREKWSGLQIIGTSAKAQSTVYEASLDDALILCVGNETDGLSRKFAEGCDQMLTIPINGAASSLNVGCAASICLYEIAKQRAIGRR